MSKRCAACGRPTSLGAVDYLLILFTVGCLVAFVRLALSAYHQEREHAEYLYDCCHHQTPHECENNWLAQEDAK